MTATRSECCGRAARKIVDGENDGLWTYEDWDDFYHTACEMIHKEIVEADLGFFIKSSTLTHAGGGEYNLPSDFYFLTFAKDSKGPLYRRDEIEIEEEKLSGFVIEGTKLILKNFVSNPDTIEIKYAQKIKEIPAWDANKTADPDTDAYKQDAPLNDRSAQRLISEIMMVLAKTRDESMTPEMASQVEGMIENFVDRLGTRVQNEPEIMGSQSY